MKRNQHFWQVLGIILWMVGGACTTSDATPPTPTFGDVNLDIVGYIDTTASADIALLNTGFVTVGSNLIRVDEARVVVERIDINTDSGEDSVDIEGPFVSRLVVAGEFLNDVYPTIEPVSIESGTYDEIRYRIQAIDPDEIPATLDGDSTVQNYLADNSLAVTGSYIEPAGHDLNGNGLTDEVPFVLRSHKDFSLRLSDASGYDILAGTTNYLYIAFQLDAWFLEAADLIALLGPTDLQSGVLYLDDESEENAADVYDAFEDAMLGSSRLGHDTNDEFDDDSDIEDDSDSAEDDEIDD